MDGNIEIIVSRQLAHFGVELRNEFTAVISDCHTTIFTKNDFKKCSLAARKRIVEDGGQVPTEVFLVGLIALSVGNELYIG